MTDAEREELAVMVARTVSAELQSKHICRLAITDQEANQLGHVVGVWADLGDGDLRKGIEETRENHKWLIKMRSRSEKTAMAIWICWLTLVVGGAATALWMGVKHLLEKQP